ncbi:hypothetical protein D1007_62490 [Hordeum vulgare]|nr:hypothetical protein D1007_62490 [Hordeum vulgare]
MTPLPISPVQRRSYRDALMTRTIGDGQAWPKRPLPANMASHPGAGDPTPVPEVGYAATSSRSGRGGAHRPERSPEFYFGTSLHRPPPPRDPARDPRLPLPGWQGVACRPEAARLRHDNVDREDVLWA